MRGWFKANELRRAAITAAAAVGLCLPSVWAQNHKQSPPPPSHPQPQQHSAPAPHAQTHPESPKGQPRTYSPPPNAQPRPANAPPQTYTPPRTPPPNQFNQPQPVPNPGQHYFAPQTTRPAYPGYRSPATAPPGHLQNWLDQHRNVPVAVYAAGARHPERHAEGRAVRTTEIVAETKGQRDKGTKTGRNPWGWIAPLVCA